MIIFKSYNVYDVLKESHILSYADPTVSCSSGVTDSFHNRFSIEIHELFLIMNVVVLCKARFDL